MAVCGDPESRHGIVLAKNEHAKRYGIVTAETVWQAKRKCPQLVMVPPHYERYEDFYRRINALYCEYTDRVEPFSIDESWLDVTGSRLLFGDGRQIADALRRRVKNELGITISVGVSFNKTLAKMGSDYRKPNATTVFSKDNYQEILYPMPLHNLIFAGRSTCETLARMGIRTIGDLAHSDRACVVAAIGKLGGQLHDYANGIDPTPVRLFTDKREMKSCGNGMTFPQDLTTEDQVRNGLLYLTEPVAARLRSHGLFCKTVHVTVKYPSLKTVSHQRTLAAPTAVTADLYQAALQALHDCWQVGTAVRSLTVTACNLCDDEQPEQLNLFAESDGKHERQVTLDSAVDSLRDRFGNEAVKRCAILRTTGGQTHEK
jgi:DNA polymerase-4